MKRPGGEIENHLKLLPSRHGPDFHQPQSQITIESPDFHPRWSQKCLLGSIKMSGQYGWIYSLYVNDIQTGRPSHIQYGVSRIVGFRLEV